MHGFPTLHMAQSMTQSIAQIGNSKPNWPEELSSEVMSFLDDRGKILELLKAKNSHIASLQDYTKALEESLRQREENYRGSIHNMNITIGEAWAENEALHKQVSKLSRQLAGSRAAKTRLKKKAKA